MLNSAKIMLVDQRKCTTSEKIRAPPPDPPLVCITFAQCVVPENIHTPTMEGIEIPEARESKAEFSLKGRTRVPVAGYTSQYLPTFKLNINKFISSVIFSAHLLFCR